MSVAGSIIGVLVIPTVLWMSLFWLHPAPRSTVWKGGSRVLSLITVPFNPSRILIIF